MGETEADGMFVAAYPLLFTAVGIVACGVGASEGAPKSMRPKSEEDDTGAHCWGGWDVTTVDPKSRPPAKRSLLVTSAGVVRLGPDDATALEPPKSRESRELLKSGVYAAGACAVTEVSIRRLSWETATGFVDAGATEGSEISSKSVPPTAGFDDDEAEPFVNGVSKSSMSTGFSTVLVVPFMAFISDTKIGLNCSWRRGMLRENQSSLYS
mmetsp:Transcript_109062/g.170543  ORF Transcript_109062/g.170543 Transcript_109062/m.170543 type:complete len:211 (-) Transcript_109062:371-1003(-)